jgi:hypothetical protein
VGGLPWLNPTDVRGVKPEGGKNKYINSIKKFKKILLGAGGPMALRKVACDGKNIYKKNYFYFNFFPFFLSSFGLNPADVHGVKPWEPPTSYLPTPTSYLYYYIRLLMSLISLFFFALTFGKPLNYFTCEKEDF